MPIKFWIYDCLYTICDNERVVFLQMTTQMINPSTKQYIYNSLLISWNKFKYM